MVRKNQEAYGLSDSYREGLLNRNFHAATAGFVRSGITVPCRVAGQVIRQVGKFFLPAAFRRAFPVKKGTSCASKYSIAGRHFCLTYLPCPVSGTGISPRPHSVNAMDIFVSDGTARPPDRCPWLGLMLHWLISIFLFPVSFHGETIKDQTTSSASFLLGYFTPDASNA